MSHETREITVNTQTQGDIMGKIETQPAVVMTSVDHHVAAAEHHEEAAESHRQAAAHFTYGDYQQANEKAQLAKSYGQKAEEHCLRAME